MSAAASKEKNVRMSAYMKDHPNEFPDSISKPWRGNGIEVRQMARTMGHVSNNTTAWANGMLGGYLFAKLGYGSYGVEEYLNV